MKKALLALIPALMLGQVNIPEGTKVRVRLEQTLSSATAEEGQPVQLSVTEDVKVGGKVAIAQGAATVGTIVQAVPKRRMGRTGKLDVSIERTVAVDGDSIPLRYTVNKREGGSHGVRTGILTAGAAVVFWPAAPVFLLMKGKDVTLNKGMVFDVFTDQNHALREKPETVAVAAASAPGPVAPQPETPLPVPAGTVEPTVVIISSETPGAEIEMDGAFVGSTPSTLHVAPGRHKIVVKSGADVWQREVQVHGGSSISLVASFKRK